MPEPSAPTRVFISYRGSDAAWTERLAERLRERSFDPWLDRFEIRAGDSIPEKIRAGLAAADALLLVLTPEALADDAGWMRHEWESFLARQLSGEKLRIVPLVLRSCEIPADLAHLRRLDFRDDSRFEAVLQELVAALQGGAAAPSRELRDEGRAERGAPSGGSPAPLTLVPARSIWLAGTQYGFIPKGAYPLSAATGPPPEPPRQRAPLHAFFLAAIAVTNDEFSRFVAATGHRTDAEVYGAGLVLVDGAWVLGAGADWRHPAGPASDLKDKGRHPVVQVSWWDATRYCRWLAESSGHDVRLPWEREWEAAAGGPEGLVWSFGNELVPGRANLQGSGPTPVATFPANELGLYDMSGNVYQWCLDGDAGRPAEGPSGGATQAPAPDSGVPGDRPRVLKGGSWFDRPEHCRTHHRFSANPRLSAANWGFRCCLELDDRLLGDLLADRRWGLSAREMI